MILILGGGLTGLTVAYELEKKKIDYLVIEKEDELGGLCRTQKEKGFIFDYTGHFFHFSSKQKKIQRFVFELLNNKFLKIHRNSKIYTKYSQKDNKLLPYPFQANIKFLHPHIRKECLKELLKSNLQHKSPKNPPPPPSGSW
jgi:protoporphyrinogen oxidase